MGHQPGSAQPPGPPEGTAGLGEELGQLRGREGRLGAARMGVGCSRPSPGHSSPNTGTKVRSQARNTPSFLSSTLNLHDKQQRNKKCYKLKPRFPRRSSFKQPFAVFWVPAATAVVIRRRWTLTSWHHLADVLNREDRQLLPGVDPDHAVAEAGHRQHGSSRRRASQLGRPGEQRRAG